MAYVDKINAGGELRDIHDTAGRRMIAPIELTATATAPHAKGEYFIYNDTLYEATSAIDVGGTITPNTNCTAVPDGVSNEFGGEISQLKSALADAQRSVTNHENLLADAFVNIDRTRNDLSDFESKTTDKEDEIDGRLDDIESRIGTAEQVIKTKAEVNDLSALVVDADQTRNELERVNTQIDDHESRLVDAEKSLKSKAEANNLLALAVEQDATHRELQQLESAVQMKAEANILAAAQVEIDKLEAEKADSMEMNNAITTKSNEALSLAVEVDQNSRNIRTNSDAISAFQGALADTNSNVVNKLTKPRDSPSSDGQMLIGNQDGTTGWTDPVAPTDEQIGEAVSGWLEEHPEATTTVEDGSITMAKLSQEVQDAIGNNDELSDYIIEADLNNLETELCTRQTVTEDTFRERLNMYCNLWLGGTGIGFIFFSDPHTASEDLDLTGSEFDLLMKTARIVYEGSPAEWVLCGGDWLNVHHPLSEAVALCAPLQKKMQTLIGPGAYTIVGNHDLNIEIPGVGGSLTHAQLNRMWYGMDTGYFVLHQQEADCYVLDSGGQSESSGNIYQRNQLNWFAEKLLSNTNKHLFGAIHIVKVDDRFGDVSDKVTAIANAFNNRTTITINGTTYDFSDANGTFHFLIAGHLHSDQIISQNNIPVLIIRRVFWDGECSMDMCYADFDNAVLHAVRIGSGPSRDMDIVPTIES